jgi:hypothetical protein
MHLGVVDLAILKVAVVIKRPDTHTAFFQPVH